VHRAFGDRLVDALDGDTELLFGVIGSSLCGFEDGAGARAKFGTNCTIASVALFGLTVALDLALDVCHDGFDLCVDGPGPRAS